MRGFVLNAYLNGVRSGASEIKIVEKASKLRCRFDLRNQSENVLAHCLLQKEISATSIGKTADSKLRECKKAMQRGQRFLSALTQGIYTLTALSAVTFVRDFFHWLRPRLP
jgi:hypothetical protein